MAEILVPALVRSENLVPVRSENLVPVRSEKPVRVRVRSEKPAPVVGGNIWNSVEKIGDVLEGAQREAVVAVVGVVVVVMGKKKNQYNEIMKIIKIIFYISNENRYTKFEGVIIVSIGSNTIILFTS